MAAEVRILNAGLEIDDELDDLIIRGTIDQASLKYIDMAWYQREQGFSDKHTGQIMNAYFQGSKIEDITIGMRGKRCHTAKGDDSTYILQDKCFCMNGGQRLYAAAMAVRDRPDLKIKLGAKVFINTTEEFENELFCKLGTTQVRVGASVLLRNRRKKSVAANALFQLNNNLLFALKGRVAWDQVRSRGDLMSGFTLARIIGAVHAHKGGGLRSARVYDLLAALDVLIEKIGVENFRTNTIRFFDALDRCWTVRQLSGARGERRPHLNSEFLLVIAKLMSSYSEFWDGKDRNEFYFADKYVKKLKGFKVGDYVRTANKIPHDALYEILRKRLSLTPIFEADEAAAVA